MKLLKKHIYAYITIFIFLICIAMLSILFYLQSGDKIEPRKYYNGLQQSAQRTTDDVNSFPIHKENFQTSKSGNISCWLDGTLFGPWHKYTVYLQVDKKQLQSEQFTSIEVKVIKNKHSTSNVFQLTDLSVKNYDDKSVLYLICEPSNSDVKEIGEFDIEVRLFNPENNNICTFTFNVMCKNMKY